MYLKKIKLLLFMIPFIGLNAVAYDYKPTNITIINDSSNSQGNNNWLDNSFIIKMRNQKSQKLSFKLTNHNREELVDKSLEVNWITPISKTMQCGGLIETTPNHKFTPKYSLGAYCYQAIPSRYLPSTDAYILAKHSNYDTEKVNKTTALLTHYFNNGSYLSGGVGIIESNVYRLHYDPQISYTISFSNTSLKFKYNNFNDYSLSKKRIENFQTLGEWDTNKIKISAGYRIERSEDISDREYIFSSLKYRF